MTDNSSVQLRGDRAYTKSILSSCLSGLDDPGGGGQHMSGAAAAAAAAVSSSSSSALYGHRSNSSASSASPPAAAGASANSMLVVPQPINAASGAKMGGGGGGGQGGMGQNGSAAGGGGGGGGGSSGGGGSGRKYQCKMCPQVRRKNQVNIRFSTVQYANLIRYPLSYHSCSCAYSFLSNGSFLCALPRGNKCKTHTSAFTSIKNKPF